MGLILKDTGDFKLSPAGQHHAVCVDVIDKGLVAVEWEGKKRTQHKCRIVWEIDALMEDGKTRYTAGRQFTASLGEKAALRAFLEAWRGRPFTEDELSGFDTEQLIGINALIQIVHTKKGDRTYDNINSIMKLVKGMEKMSPSGKYIRVKDRTPAEQAQNSHDDPPPLDDSDLPF